MSTISSTATQPALGRPKIALDFVVANALAAPPDAPYNTYIRAFSQDGALLDTLFTMARRRYARLIRDTRDVFVTSSFPTPTSLSVAVKQLLNHKFLKKEITELYGALSRVEECLARAQASCPASPQEAPAEPSPLAATLYPGRGVAEGLRAGAAAESDRYCTPCALLSGCGEDNKNSAAAMFPLLRRHAHRVSLVDLCCGKGVQVNG